MRRIIAVQPDYDGDADTRATPEHNPIGGPNPVTHNEDSVWRSVFIRQDNCQTRLRLHYKHYQSIMSLQQQGSYPIGTNTDNIYWSITRYVLTAK